MPIFVLILGAAFALAAYGHTEAAPPAIPMNVVMQTIRDLRDADWQKLQLGFANIEKAYGLSDEQFVSAR